MKNWFLHNGLVYREGKLSTEDLLIIDGKIKAFGEEATQLRAEFLGAIQDIDASDMLVSRGFIDLHVHLREPGGESKETIATGTQAAAAGGYTCIYAMPNTTPALDSLKALENFQRLVKDNAKIKVRPVAALTIDRQNQSLVDYQGLIQAGVKFFSDDGDPISASLVGQAMEQLVGLQGILVNHLEDKSLVKEGFFYESIPAESEYTMLERDLEFVAQTKCSYHAAHLSCAESVALIVEAKANGLPVTAEVTPHHLVLTYEDITSPAGHYQMKPPLRSQADRAALIEGLRSGVIDVIATDHAPHGREKENELKSGAPFGVTGLETAFPVLYSKLVKTGQLELEQLLYCLTIAPAKISGEPLGLAEGTDADLVLIDLNKARTVEQEMFFSKGTNSPFIGQVLQGWPVLTLVDGEERYNVT